MKCLIVSLLVLINSSLFSQVQKKSKPFSVFNLEVLGGVNYTNVSGPSFIVEGRTNLIRHLNFQFAVGYLEVYKDDFRKVKAYQYINVPGMQEYQTENYNINDTRFHIAQFSMGFEYALNNYGKFTPYSFINGSYNAYDAKYRTSPILVGPGYKSYDQIPSEYKHKIPSVPASGSFGIGIGIGTRYNLFDNIKLDLRYIFQVNSSIVNMHQVLVGFVF